MGGSPSSFSEPTLTAPNRHAPGSITGLLLAGGRGSRMGGVDKGLQPLCGEPLAAHVLKRLAPQTDAIVISANRNADAYAALGAPFSARVVADSVADFPGPLAGLLAGLQAAHTDFVLSVPCDVPNLPEDLAARLIDGLIRANADIATVVTGVTGVTGVTKVDTAVHNPEPPPTLHPVFALLRPALAADLSAFLLAGERKVRAWYARHTTVEVSFTDERAFYNINSLQELADLERA